MSDHPDHSIAILDMLFIATSHMQQINCGIFWSSLSHGWNLKGPAHNTAPSISDRVVKTLGWETPATILDSSRRTPIKMRLFNVYEGSHVAQIQTTLSTKCKFHAAHNLRKRMRAPQAAYQAMLQATANQISKPKRQSGCQNQKKDDVVLRHTLPVFTGLGRCPIVSWDFPGAVSILRMDALPVVHQ